MIKTSLKPLALLVAAATAPAQAQLIISEYLEGSSNNKAVELYNTSGAELSLDGYTISLFSNGNGDLTAPIYTDEYYQIDFNISYESILFFSTLFNLIQL